MDNVDGISFVIISFLICFLIIFLSLFNGDENSVKSLFNIICNNYYPVRNLISFSTINDQYLKKFENFSKSHLFLTSTYLQDEYESFNFTHRFFKVLEFTIAEIIIRYCYFIYRNDDAYIKKISWERAKFCLNLYLSIFEEKDIPKIKKGLKVRTIRNICKVYNTNLFVFVLLNDFFRKELNSPYTYKFLTSVPEYKTYYNGLKGNSEKLTEFNDFIKKLFF